jgi:leader peptidase (prepilin peptidase)/N-methyltransferase
MSIDLEIVFVFMLGCVIGSFLNVVRYRLPRKAGMVSGRSMCPECGRRIAWYDNIPILSFILLRGRCRQCGWTIPLIYPVIEAATGVSFALVWHSFVPGQAVAYLVLSALLIVSAGIDYDLRIIPDKITLPGMVLGLLFSVTLLKTGPVDRALVGSLLGIAAGGGTLFVIAVAYKLLRRIEGMGGGDVKLMAMVGAFLGYKLALLTIFVASVAGGIIGLFLVHRSSEGMKTSVPFGVFLSPAGIFCLLWGDALVGAYLNLIK